jgi:hypothetical protein
MSLLSIAVVGALAAFAAAEALAFAILKEARPAMRRVRAE